MILIANIGGNYESTHCFVGEREKAYRGNERHPWSQGKYTGEPGLTAESFTCRILGSTPGDSVSVVLGLVSSVFLTSSSEKI